MSKGRDDFLHYRILRKLAHASEILSKASNSFTGKFINLEYK